MADLGLPLSFGKQSLPTRPDVASASASTSASASAPRGGPAGRGPRGVVGGGKRGRGRGRGVAAAAGGGAGSEIANDVSLDEGIPLFNSGVKRPHNPTNLSPPQPPLQSNHNHNHNRNHHSQTPPRGSFGGGRGGPSNRGGPGGPGGPGGGGRGGRGGFHSGRGERGHGDMTSETGQRGFYKPSFVEDPWAELMEKRARKLAGRG